MAHLEQPAAGSIHSLQATLQDLVASLLGPTVSEDGTSIHQVQVPNSVGVAVGVTLSLAFLAWKLLQPAHTHERQALAQDPLNTTLSLLQRRPDKTVFLGIGAAFAVGWSISCASLAVQIWAGVVPGRADWAAVGAVVCAAVAVAAGGRAFD